MDENSVSFPLRSAPSRSSWSVEATVLATHIAALGSNVKSMMTPVSHLRAESDAALTDMATLEHKLATEHRGLSASTQVYVDHHKDLANLLELARAESAAAGYVISDDDEDYAALKRMLSVAAMSLKEQAGNLNMVKGGHTGLLSSLPTVWS